MSIHADKSTENTNKSVANGSHKLPGNGESVFQPEDNRPVAIAQRKLRETINNSPQVKQLLAYQAMANQFVAEGKGSLYQETVQSVKDYTQNPVHKVEFDQLTDSGIKKENNATNKAYEIQQQKIASGISSYRSETVAQLKYNWTEEEDDGVIIGNAGEPLVIKLGGYDALAVPLDQLGAAFGFTSANARVVRDGDGEWAAVLAAVDDAGGWDKTGSDKAKTEALVMDRLVGNPLHETVDAMDAGDPDNPTPVELARIKRMCLDLGKMLVMDLVTRNNDRFNLVKFDDELLSTDAEKMEDDKDWRNWMANEGNILVNTATGAANPIDSQFTGAGDEPQYAQNVAALLVTRADDLAASGMMILENNWANQGYARDAFRQGIANGIERLLQL